MPTPSKHAKLAPSAADRWGHCPGSVAANKNAPRRETKYTLEGTLAHAIAELKLRKHFGLCMDGAKKRMGPKTYQKELSKLQADENYSPDMDGYTDAYVDYITDLANSFDSRPAVFVEQDLNLSDFVPDSFGQADCILIHDKDLYINDLKYGKGVPVDAPKNPQLQLYALGAIMAYKDFWQIDTVHLAIIQPRLSHISEDTMTTADLLDWGTFTVRPAAEAAAAETEEYHAGKWCRWCAIYATCRKQVKSVVTPAEDCGGKLPPEISMQEFAEVLHRLDALKSYETSAREYAEKVLLNGEQIPGWKLISGKGKRVWTDQDAAFAALVASGVDKTLLWHNEPYTLAALEKQLGKKAFGDTVGDYITVQPGKPKLAPASDTHADWSPRYNADDDFAALIKNQTTTN